jgi:hypothetical protein
MTALINLISAVGQTRVVLSALLVTGLMAGVFLLLN